MGVKPAAGAIAILAVLTLVMSGAWYQAHRSLAASRHQLIAATLEPQDSLLTENQALIQELQREPFAEKDAGVLIAYMARIRRDGVAKHADMKQRLDQLAENNTAIVALIKAYAPQARTAAYVREADKFRNYASAWRDRWNSVMELFMAGGNYATVEVPFPKAFPAAVKAERALVP